jgi:hypothetical protein
MGEGNSLQDVWPAASIASRDVLSVIPLTTHNKDDSCNDQENVDDQVASHSRVLSTGEVKHMNRYSRVHDEVNGNDLSTLPLASNNVASGRGRQHWLTLKVLRTAIAEDGK